MSGVPDETRTEQTRSIQAGGGTQGTARRPWSRLASRGRAERSGPAFYRQHRFCTHPPLPPHFASLLCCSIFVVPAGRPDCTSIRRHPTSLPAPLLHPSSLSSQQCSLSRPPPEATGKRTAGARALQEQSAHSAKPSPPHVSSVPHSYVPHPLRGTQSKGGPTREASSTRKSGNAAGTAQNRQ